MFGCSDWQLAKITWLDLAYNSYLIVEMKAAFFHIYVVCSSQANAICHDEYLMPSCVVLGLGLPR